MSEFNLDLLNQDKIRFKKRRRLFLYTLVPLIILILSTIFFLRTGIYNIIYSTGIAGESYGLPAVATKLQMVGNLIEPYLPYYNNGYLKLIQAESREDLVAAETEFRESLKHNPPEERLCAIYGNLSYSIELQADLLFNNQQYNDALVSYNQAESLLFENNCASKDDNQTGKDEQSEAAKDRIEEKRREAVDAANNNSDPSNNNGNGNQGGDQEISESQLQEIQDQQEEINNQAAGNPYQSHGPNTGGGGSSNFGEPNF
ncbi:hypothetical protein J6X04_00215 [Candidatus Saccharibacteria bacterium]|nr:hypothetical protein [Candidatus Saccharibacteria bacterium]